MSPWPDADMAVQHPSWILHFLLFRPSAFCTSGARWWNRVGFGDSLHCSFDLFLETEVRFYSSCLAREKLMAES